MSGRPDSTPVSHLEAAKQGVLFTISFHERFVAAEVTQVSEDGISSTPKPGLMQIGYTDSGEALLLDASGLWRAPLTSTQVPDLRGKTSLATEEYMNYVSDAMSALSDLVAKQA